MSKPAKSFYSTAIGHRDIPGAYLGSYAIPGEPPQWVTQGGQVRIFTGPNAKTEAELAGFKVLVSKLNRAHDVQEFVARRAQVQQPRVYRAPRGTTKTDRLEREEHTIESVFGKTK